MVCKEFEKTKMEGEKGFAVILTNPLKQTTVRMQKSSKNQVDGYSVCWDYHVVFVLKSSEGAFVYDHDSRLQWGVPFKEYYDQALATKKEKKKTFYRRF